MLAHAGKYFLVYILSTLKFIGGPVYGASFGLNIFETSLFTILGAMTSVVVFSYLGDEFRTSMRKRAIKRGKNRRTFTKRRRRIVKIYQRFGIKGIAFFTPLLLTPIGGTIVALSFGVPRKKIIWTMLPYCIIWGVIISVSCIVFWHELRPLFHR